VHGKWQPMRLRQPRTTVAPSVIAALVATAMAAAAAQAPSTAPTYDELSNATYRGIYDQAVRLEQGFWEGEPFVPSGASRPRVQLVRDFLRTGDVNGDGRAEAVVLLGESSGGSGARVYLAVAGRQSGQVVNLATVSVGDRVQVRAARVASRRIELDVVQAGPQDAPPAVLPRPRLDLGVGREPN